MVDSSCGGTFLHKTADEAWDLFENLSDNLQQHATSSRVGTSRQIGNRGMYEVSQNEQVNVAQGFHRQNDPYSKTYNSCWRNHPNFSWKQQEGEGQLGQQQYQQNKQPGMTAPPETQIGQLANAISRRDEGKLPSHPIENPRANYHEQAKAVITIRNGKLVDNKVGEPIKDSESNNNETKGISMTKIESKREKELASSSNFKTLESSPTTSYKPKGDGLMFYICYNFCMTYT
ncbi:hypothetical protein M9H77_32020 [Catharanthus roseus]|uniref:Uncharacterized protein n=1 Tax=Catharanthus roseus TaxID=4058 RepID=A0ACC0A5Y8_CATRO|nr:hypothetical protein M9H77_32020 [Catharanthus roseus]